MDENKESRAQNKTDFDKYVLLTEWPKIFDYPRLGTLRALVFNAKKNGFDKVVRKVGGRVLIGVKAYHEWLDEYGKI